MTAPILRAVEPEDSSISARRVKSDCQGADAGGGQTLFDNVYRSTRETPERRPLQPAESQLSPPLFFCWRDPLAVRTCSDPRENGEEPVRRADVGKQQTFGVNFRASGIDPAGRLVTI